MRYGLELRRFGLAPIAALVFATMVVGAPSLVAQLPPGVGCPYESTGEPYGLHL